MYSFLISIAAILIATKLFGELARKFGQSSSIGAVFAGAVLGANGLSLLDPRDPTLHSLAQLGLLVLVFQIGLRTDVGVLRRTRGTTLMVAAAAIALPFGGGFAVAHYFGFRVLASLIVGAALTATSFGISSKVLGDAGVFRTREAEITRTAVLAVDVFGVLALSVLVSLDGVKRVSFGDVGRTIVVAVAFIAATLAVGRYAMPPLFRLLDRIRGRDSLGLFGVALAIVLSAIAILSGLAMIIGAFLAGAILQPTPQRGEIDRTATSLGHFLVPIFFAVVGASVDLSAPPSQTAVVLTVLLIAAGIGGKILAGYAPWWFQGNKLLIGTSMVPGGEVGLIFAQMGLATAAISPQLFGAVVLTSVATTFVTPLLVTTVVSRDEDLEKEEATPAEAFKTPDGRRLTAVGRKQTPGHRR